MAEGFMSGFQDQQRSAAQTGLLQQNVQAAQVDMAGRAAFGRALQQAMMPGAQPMPGQGAPPPQPPMPGQPSQPMGRPGMGGPPQASMVPGQQPMPGVGGPGMGQGSGGGAPMPQYTGGPMAGGGGMPQGQFDLRTVMSRIAAANPGAPPAVIAAAIDHAMPLLNAQARMEWQQERLALQEQNMGLKAELGYGNLDARNRGLDYTGRRVDESARHNQAQEGFTDRRLGDTEYALEQRATQFNRRDETARRGQDMRAEQTQGNREFRREQGEQKRSGQVDAFMSDLNQARDLLRSGKSVSGLGGMARRGLETAGGIVGAPEVFGEDAKRFQTYITRLQMQLPRLVASGRILKSEAGNIDTQLRGLARGDTRYSSEAALNDLERSLNTAMGRAAPDSRVAPRSSAEPARPRQGTPAPAGPDTAPGRPLMPMTPEKKSAYQKAIAAGYDRTEIENHLRAQGFDPASN